MCNEDISIEEYKMIRKGLDDIYLTISNYNIALYTASGALFAFAFGKDEFYYCLIPLMVILPLYLLAEQKHKAACKLGAYLLVFCEGKTFNWETRNHNLGKKYVKGTREIKDILPYISLAAVSCLSSMFKIYKSSDPQFAYLAIPIIILIICLIIIMKVKVNYPTTRQAYIKKWVELKKEEEKKKGTGNATESK